MFLYPILLGGVFLTVVFATLGIYDAFVGSRSMVLKNLKTQALSMSAPQAAARRRGLRERTLHFLNILGKAVPQKAKMKHIQHRLLQAHILMRAEEFIGATLVSGVGLFLLIYAFSNTLLLALVGGLLGLRIPDMVVNIRRSRIANSINQQLPEALTIITNGLRAGFSFPQAMNVVSREMDPPIADEFARVIRENSLGKPMEEVLHNLSERVDSDNIEMLVTALLIQRQVGGNLAEVLDNISHTIRERIRVKGEIRTLTAQQKISAVIILLLPPGVAVFISIANPEYMLALVRHPLGLIILAAAVLLQIIGIIFIRRIINIEV